MLSIEWADGTSSEFASLWLRDNLREDRDPHSGQRLVDIADLPEDPRIRSAAAQQRRGAHRMGSRAAPGAFDTRVAARERLEPLRRAGRSLHPSSGSRAPVSMPCATSRGRPSPMRMATDRCAPSG